MKTTKQKKPLNVAQRVEILLKEGVEPVKKWIGVARFDESDIDRDGSGWDTYEALHEHHEAETKHLLEVIAEMREQILSMDEQLDAKFGPKVKP